MLSIITKNCFLCVLQRVRHEYCDLYVYIIDSKWEDKVFKVCQYVVTSIEQHLPNATLGYSDPSTGSDVLSILELFLDNSQVPVCGSQLLILVKRYPNSQDISPIVARLRQHHAYVFFIVSNNNSGGSSPEILYNIATETNGFCGFQDEDKFSEVLITRAVFSMKKVQSAALGPSGMYPNLIYATNVRVSGKGSTILPPYDAKNVPITDIMLTLQDHGPLSSFQRFKLSWNNIDSDDSGNLDNSKSDVEKLYGNSTFYDPDALLFLDPVVYNITFEYEYSDTKSQVLQIRFYSH
ncbi:hypothetical protein CAEBREN_24227 [Caenorhabditis brenneri]|uniref:DUF7154 domain-containing protein n=1 Tax=Caenorhabditis brenneri TaxID=135651 RepID=G0N2M8_CAEBE|nr:hypothetical protein CAEBREN_24227 [Caenorhabditis brenneri]